MEIVNGDLQRDFQWRCSIEIFKGDLQCRFSIEIFNGDIQCIFSKEMFNGDFQWRFEMAVFNLDPNLDFSDFVMICYVVYRFGVVWCSLL